MEVPFSHYKSALSSGSLSLYLYNNNFNKDANTVK